MAKLYGAAPIDEIKLKFSADQYVESLNGEIPTEDYLQEITKEHGSDLATMIFYTAIIQKPENQKFISLVDKTSIQKKYPKTKIKLFIIPAFFYQEYPEVGGGGKHVLEVAESCGIDAEIIPIKSTGSVSENSLIIRQSLQTCEAKEIWIMSMSKGSAETRMVFQDHSDSIPVERIKAWFNVSGLANGCHLIDHMMRTPVSRIKTRTLCAATGASYKGLEELLTQQPNWKKQIILPESIKVYNIFGVPLLSHVQKTLISRFNRLKHLGPNDGMVLLSKAFLPTGPIYPLWGADHFLRDSRVIPLLYRLFGLLIENKKIYNQ